MTVLAVGIGQADTEELRRAVTDRSPQNILYAGNAERLNTVHPDLADLLCGIARIPEVSLLIHRTNWFWKDKSLKFSLGFVSE